MQKILKLNKYKGKNKYQADLLGAIFHLTLSFGENFSFVNTASSTSLTLRQRLPFSFIENKSRESKPSKFDGD